MCGIVLIGRGFRAVGTDSGNSNPLAVRRYSNRGRVGASFHDSRPLNVLVRLWLHFPDVNRPANYLFSHVAVIELPKFLILAKV